MRKLRRTVLKNKMYKAGIKHKHFRTMWLRMSGKQYILDREQELRDYQDKQRREAARAKADKKKSKQSKQSLGEHIGRLFKARNKQEV